MPAMFGWLRYALANGILVASLIALALGGWAIGLVLALLLVLGIAADEAIGDDECRLTGSAAWFHNVNLYATLPLLAGLSVLHWRLVNGDVPLGLAHQLVPALGPAGLDPILGRGFNVFAATMLVGYCYATIGATVAHELTHRTGSRAALLSARGLLAFMFNTAFTVFHLHGHHRYVGTSRDPATARRGEYILAFLVCTTVEQFTDAWRYETARLRRQGRPAWSRRNRVLIGQAYSLAIAAAAGAVAGWPGALAFLAAALIGRSLHESVNYIQHYGLVRAEGSPVEPRHTWDCGRTLSNALHYNLPRHADHHLAAAKPFWDLATAPRAPKLPHGYQSMVVIAVVPPLWKRVMGPLLADWDRRFASDAERAIVRSSGWYTAA